MVQNIMGRLLIYIALAICTFIMLVSYKRSKRPAISALKGCLSGFIGFIAAYLLGLIRISFISFYSSCILGIPAVVFLSLAEKIL